jgi:septum formation protein
LADKPLVLASRSASRQAVLEAAGIPVEIRPADIDERAIEASAGVADAGAVARLLAREKAKAVSGSDPQCLVMGADQTMSLASRRFSKPVDRAGAREQLRALRGQTHTLYSAVAIVRAGSVVFEHLEPARLTVRNFSDDFLERYLDAVGDRALSSVGGYQLEGLGIQLFERIEGDHFTILGMPLLRPLRWLREQRHLSD